MKERGSGLGQDDEFSYRPAGFEVPMVHLSRVTLLATGSMGLDPNDIWLYCFRTEVELSMVNRTKTILDNHELS